MNSNYIRLGLSQTGEEWSQVHVKVSRASNSRLGPIYHTLLECFVHRLEQRLACSRSPTVFAEMMNDYVCPYQAKKILMEECGLLTNF